MFLNFAKKIMKDIYFRGCWLERKKEEEDMKKYPFFILFLLITGTKRSFIHE